MKASVGAGILLVLIFIAVGINAAYVHRVTNEMRAQVAALPEIPNESTEARITEFQNYLRDKLPLLRLTISYPQLDRVGELSTSLKGYAQSDALSDYRITRALLLDALQDVERTERLRQDSP